MQTLPAVLPAVLTSFLCACVIAVGQGSCADTRVGSGMEATESRGVGEFSRLHVGGSATVTASTGEETSVILRCDDNLLPYVRTEVKGETLHVSMVSGSYQFKSGLEVTIVSPRLAQVGVSGAGNATVSGVDEDHFEANVSGAGNLHVSGRADTVDVRVSGAGNLDLSQLTARAGEVHVSGAGGVEINARESLAAHVSGAGHVHYAGNPDVEQHVSGAGSVSRK